jgi:hypothetical protein
MQLTIKLRNDQGTRAYRFSMSSTQQLEAAEKYWRNAPNLVELEVEDDLPDSEKISSIKDITNPSYH